MDKIDDAQLEEIARDGPDAIKKLFAIQGIHYGVKEIIENHFVMMGKNSIKQY